MTTVFKNVNLLNPESFKFEKKLFVKDELFNSEFKESKKIAEIITLCNLYNVKLDKRHFLYGLKDAELDQVRSAIVKYVGVSIFDLDKVYGLQEAIKTILQYARDYGSFDIPREFWDSEVKIPKFKYKETIISCLTFTDYIKELQSIIASSKNPDSRDLNYLQQTVNLETLCCGVIPNRNVLKELVKNVKNFKFKCHTTASLRVFIEAKLDSKQKLKTSDKTFIMNTLNQLDKAEILDDFAANRRFWKFTERNVIPTQKRYEKFKKARAAFANLRDNAFYESNNSKIENAEMDLIEKFNQMRELKSDNFAIRNVTKLLSWYNPDDNEVEELIEEIKKTNVSLKQLLELFRSIDYSGVDRNYVKIKGKFWSYERERKDNRLMFELLQDVVKEKFKALTNDYMKDINSETKLAEDYKKLPSIEVPKDRKSVV